MATSSTKRASDDREFDDEEIADICDTMKRFRFEIPPPSDRRVSFGRWDITLRVSDHAYSVFDTELQVAVPGPFLGVTSFAESLFPRFDADEALRKMRPAVKAARYPGMSVAQIKRAWELDNIGSACVGTQLHAALELLLSRDGPYRRNFAMPGLRKGCGCPAGAHQPCAGNKAVGIARDEHVHAMLEHFEREGLVPVCLEQCMFNRTLRLCGTADAVMRNVRTGKLAIYDFKSGKKWTESNAYENGLPGTPVAHMPDCKQAVAIVQLNMYRCMYRCELGEDATELHVLRLNPNLTTYEDIMVPVDDDLAVNLADYRIAQLTAHRL